MSESSKIVAASIIGADFVNVIVNGKAYVVHPPTVHKIAGAGWYLSDIGEGQSVRDVIKSLNNSGSLAHALSWFINGNDSLFEELSHGTTDELIDAVSEAYSLISVESFAKLSDLVRSVSRLIANQK